jgi:hypothetical protein
MIWTSSLQSIFFYLNFQKAKMEVYTIRGSWNGTDQLSELSQARSAKLWYSTECFICISESQCGSIQIQSKQRT